MYINSEFKIPDKNGEAPDDQSKVTMASMEGNLNIIEIY